MEGLDWIMVTASRLVRQRSRGPACYGVLRDRLRFLGPVQQARRCTPEDILQAPAVLVKVVKKPPIPEKDTWAVAPSNMWQAEHAAAMCKALQGHVTAISRAPAAQSSGNRPAASLATLHGGARAWCWVIVAVEPHASALGMYDRGEATKLTVHPADFKTRHLGALSGDGGRALFLHGTVVGSAAVRFRTQCEGYAFRLVMAENMAPWLRVLSTSRWKIEGDREKFADAWRR